jgi:hypothetical protein
MCVVREVDYDAPAGIPVQDSLKPPATWRSSTLVPRGAGATTASYSATSPFSQDLDIPPSRSAASLLDLASAPRTASSLLSFDMKASPARKSSGTFHYGPDNPLEGRSLFIFGPDNLVRKAVARVVAHPWFEHAILVMVLASSVVLALDSPVLDPNGPMAATLTIVDYIFVAAFAVEALMKAVAMGFAFNGKCSYLRSGWNILDFLIMVLGIIMVGLERGAVGGSSQLAMLR